MPNSISELNQGIFRECTSLNNVSIPNTITNIGWVAFDSCKSLTNITIPESVTNIESQAFSGCTSLTEIICESSTPAIVYDNFVFQYIPATATLYVPVGSYDAYASANGWSYFTNIVENDEITGLENTLTDNKVNISVENGNIVINGTDNAKVEIYSANGQCVYNGTATTIPVTAKGLYIVKVGNKSYKVML